MGGGYVFQEAEQRGGSKALTFPVFGEREQSSTTCCQDMLRNSRAD
jgi:hypothetical protein